MGPWAHPPEGACVVAYHQVGRGVCHHLAREEVEKSFQEKVGCTTLEEGIRSGQGAIILDNHPDLVDRLMDMENLLVMVETKQVEK